MNIKNVDSLLPPEMALQAELIGVSKVNMSLSKTLVLAMLAGAFIAFWFYIFLQQIYSRFDYVIWNHKTFGGFFFLVLASSCNCRWCRYFAGNNLVIMAWANKKISTSQIFKNWFLVCLKHDPGIIHCFLMFFKQYSFCFGHSRNKRA